mmetsp:Transcript_77/g.117  ORF Transcript_77/g.117 Transcript_77/m.117 type:complete len:176 (-) Transcript_77:1948-2475(-)
MLPLRPFFLLLTLIALSIAPSHSQQRNYNHDGGLWGEAKRAASTIATPVEKAVQERYDTLSDRGKFVAGAAFGFGASRFAVSTTVNTVKTVGAAYIAFEALEYAGILKEARSTKEGDAIIAKTRDYLLRTADGLRMDIRTNLNPNALKERIDRNMKRDKPGTTGFGTGAFLGFIL